jgi:iron-sulfur cluster repair protein YtfE (RIC family)
MSEETWSRVGQEHEEHARQVKELTQALHSHPVDLPEVRRVIARIDRELPGHLRREELVVLPWLTRVLPETAPEVELLAKEHLQLFASITSLRFSLATPGAAVGPLATSALAFLNFFRDHLFREEALIERAIARGQIPPGHEPPGAVRPPST